MDNLAGKVAFVTGGASGIGQAIVRALAGAGMKVAIVDVEAGALAAAVAEFDDSNVEVMGVELDVVDPDAMDAAADRVEAQLGPVQVLCNNAGVFVSSSLAQARQEDWRWVNGVNVNGVINGVQTFLPRMIAHGRGGHIVNTASLAGHMAPAGLGVYNTGKFAVVGLSESLRADLEGSTVGISVLCPGIVRTNIGDAGRNRPDALKTPETPNDTMIPAAGPTDPEQSARAEQFWAGALDPAHVGDMVATAVREGDFYIFTHPEYRSIIEARFAGIDASFERWAAWRAENGV